MKYARAKSPVVRGVRAGLGLLLTFGFAILGGQSLAIPSVIAADVPSTPATAPFSAPQCADISGAITPTTSGNVVAEPDVNVVADGGGVIRDLTQVFGARLDAYNAGNVVPLYDSYGTADAGSYPPLCGVRYDAQKGGPVSEWMFCTDIHSAVCGNLDGFGNTTNDGGNVLLPMEQFPVNPKLDLKDRHEDERIIAYIIQNGFDGYHGFSDGIGYGYDYFNGPGRADSESGLYPRLALQVLVWCISDAPLPTNTSNWAKTCAQNITPEKRTEILAKIPADPALTLTFTQGTQTVALGEVAHFTLETNLYNLPITVTATPAGAVALCPGSAGTLDADGLVVTPTDPAEPTTIVDLCLTGTTAAEYTLNASASPPSTSHIEWNQSKNADPEAKPCQVYASFDSVRPFVQTSTALVTYGVTDTTSGGGGGGDTQLVTLPSTGGDAPSWLVLLGLFLPALGGALLVRRVRLS